MGIEGYKFVRTYAAYAHMCLLAYHIQSCTISYHIKLSVTASYCHVISPTISHYLALTLVQSCSI